MQLGLGGLLVQHLRVSCQAAFLRLAKKKKNNKKNQNPSFVSFSIQPAFVPELKISRCVAGFDKIGFQKPRRSYCKSKQNDEGS